MTTMTDPTFLLCRVFWTSNKIIYCKNFFWKVFCRDVLFNEEVLIIKITELINYFLGDSGNGGNKAGAVTGDGGNKAGAVAGNGGNKGGAVTGNGGNKGGTVAGDGGNKGGAAAGNGGNKGGTVAGDWIRFSKSVLSYKTTVPRSAVT